MVVFLDTHAAIHLAAGAVDELGKESRQVCDSHDIRISPIVVLEMELLYEVKRLKMPVGRLLETLARDVSLALCDLPFAEIIEVARKETWTRDPFDRLIVAHARARQSPLVTRDRLITKHYSRAIW